MFSNLQTLGPLCSHFDWNKYSLDIICGFAIFAFQLYASEIETVIGIVKLANVNFTHPCQDQYTQHHLQLYKSDDIGKIPVGYRIHEMGGGILLWPRAATGSCHSFPRLPPTPVASRACCPVDRENLVLSEGPEETLAPANIFFPAANCFFADRMAPGPLLQLTNCRILRLGKF